MRKAFIIVDVQNDFCPGGALAVPQGDEVIPLINQLQLHFDLIVATQDWHPKDHMSFASQHGKKPGEVVTVSGLKQVLWPDHCVQGTKGAKFVPALAVDRVAKVFQKGSDRQIDSYSGFYDNGHKKATGLGEFLKEKKVEAVFIAGLATDYCVKYSALDALKFNFKVYVIQDACRGIDQPPGNVKQALAEMSSAGVKMTTSADVFKE